MGDSEESGEGARKFLAPITSARLRRSFFAPSGSVQFPSFCPRLTHRAEIFRRYAAVAVGFLVHAGRFSPTPAFGARDF